ncbi:MAG: hypothetical protein VB066_13150 [Paludibacter sp.]|nr:hypothetical protein [Paludibacter sp.]
MKAKVIFMAVALVAMTGAVYAQSTAKQKTQQGVNYVDENKNGVCDNYENGKGGNNPKGDGVRSKDGSGRTSSKGKGCCGNCQGMRNGQGNRGKNYVDANKNGICDNREKN